MLDYVVAKVPRFTFGDSEVLDTTPTTQMKSVGEVMAIGRNLPGSDPSKAAARVELRIARFCSSTGAHESETSGNARRRLSVPSHLPHYRHYWCAGSWYFTWMKFADLTSHRPLVYRQFSRPSLHRKAFTAKNLTPSKLSERRTSTDEAHGLQRCAFGADDFF